MSQPGTDQEYQDLDPWNGLFYSMAERLTPLFVGEGRGTTYARYAAGEAIAGYHPETRADYASIARILALSLATVTASVRASDPDMPIADQLRFLGKVQGLSQGADRAERLMAARRKRAQEEEIRGDTLVPRPTHRPSRYPPLPPEDPASGRAPAPKTKTVPQPASKAPQPDPVPAQVVTRAHQPENPAVAMERVPPSVEPAVPSTVDPAPQCPPPAVQATQASPSTVQAPIAATSTPGNAPTAPVAAAPAPIAAPAPVAAPQDARRSSFRDSPLNGHAEPPAYPSHPGPALT